MTLYVIALGVGVLLLFLIGKIPTSKKNDYTEDAYRYNNVLDEINNLWRETVKPIEKLPGIDEEMYQMLTLLREDIDKLLDKAYADIEAALSSGHKHWEEVIENDLNDLYDLIPRLHLAKTKLLSYADAEFRKMRWGEWAKEQAEEKEREKREWQEKSSWTREEKHTSWDAFSDFSSHTIRDSGYFSGCKTKSDYKKRYRKLAKKHHPDSGGDEETFLAITKEYEERICRL